MAVVLESRAPRAWSYELRAESWYLISVGFLGWKHEHGQVPLSELRASDAPDFEVPLHQVPDLVTVLNHVVEHVGLTSSGSDMAGAWTVSTVTEGQFSEPRLLVEGPVLPASTSGADLALCPGVEVPFEHTPSLLAALSPHC